MHVSRPLAGSDKPKAQPPRWPHAINTLKIDIDGTSASQAISPMSTLSQATRRNSKLPVENLHECLQK